MKFLIANLLSLLLVLSTNLVADSTKLDEAIKKYYAGYPDQAISMIEPIANSGDVDAQYLLGNILYSLSKSNKSGLRGDPSKWYKMAARQNSPGANHAMGVIHHNKWTKQRRQEDLELAITYYEKAFNLGNKASASPLSKLKSNNSERKKNNSLSYTNESFGYSNQPKRKPTKSNGNGSERARLEAQLEKAKRDFKNVPLKTTGDAAVYGMRRKLYASKAIEISKQLDKYYTGAELAARVQKRREFITRYNANNAKMQEIQNQRNTREILRNTEEIKNDMEDIKDAFGIWW